MLLFEYNNHSAHPPRVGRGGGSNIKAMRFYATVHLHQLTYHAGEDNNRENGVGPAGVLVQYDSRGDAANGTPNSPTGEHGGQDTHTNIEMVSNVKKSRTKH